MTQQRQVRQQEENGEARRSPVKMVLYVVAGTAVGATFAWLAFREQDWGQIIRSLQQVSIPLVLLGFVMVFGTGLIRAYRWRLLFVREQTTTARLYVVEHAGIGANSISPIRLLAEPIQFGLLTLNDKMRSGDVLISLSLQRTTDLLVTLVMVGVLLITVPAMAPLAEHFWLITIAVTIGALIMMSPFLLIPLSRKFPRIRRTRVARTFGETAGIMAERKARFAVVLAVTAAYWITIGVVGWVAALAVDIALPLYVMLAISLGTIIFSTSAPGLPGAFGTFEAATVFLLSLWDIPREQALLFGLVFHAMTYIPPILIALVALPREGVRSFGKVQSFMSNFWQSTSEEDEPDRVAGQGQAGDGS